VTDAAWLALERDIRERVAQQGFMAHVGATVEALAPGSCTISVVPRPALLQQYGYLHGGCIAFLVDNSATIAAATLLRPGQAVLTAEFKLNFLAPARGDRILARGRVIKPGRTITVSAADVFAVAHGEEQLVATGLATISVVPAPARADS
jgi:uncharacterized protein (TIGR00369 family)